MRGGSINLYTMIGLVTLVGLNERHLRISKRKTRMGEIEKTGFHFLGIEYPPAQIEDNTNATPVMLKKEKEITLPPDHYLREGG